MPLSTSTATRQLSDGNTSGTVLGVSATDLISFFGATPVAQPAGTAFATINPAASAGNVIIYTTSQTPTGVTPNSTNEKAFTLTGVTATEMVFVSKPTTQAGLAVCSSRVSGTNAVGVTFANLTAATITPTAGESYSVLTMPASLQPTATLSPASVAGNTTDEQQFTVTGVPSPSFVQVNKPTAQAGLAIMGARAVSNNTIGITFANATVTPIVPTASETYDVLASQGLSAANSVIEYGVNVGTVAGIVSFTTTESAIAVTGLLANDIVLGVSKPTNQAGLAIVGARVSGANSLGLTFLNTTTNVITPTASESYIVSTLRREPTAVMQLLTASLTPAAVAPNTTAEQTFTVTGVVAATSVYANKPTVQAGLSLANSRVSGTNSVVLAFANFTTATITPTAAETYVFASFPMVSLGGATNSNYVIQVADVLFSAAIGQAVAVRNAMVALGLVASG